MEKLSINGKSFDEIFNQRGLKTDFTSASKGCIYITDETIISWSCLFEYDEGDNIDCNVCFVVDQNGSIGKYTIIDAETIYEATPDQIALLELYKNQKP